MADIVTTTAAQDFTQAIEPFALFEAWFDEASASELADPNAMALATVDGHGMPNVRTLLMKGFDGPGRDDRGFVFFTNTSSKKGWELLSNPKASMLFHWKSLRRQVRIRGTVALVTNEEADDYFNSRPRGSRIGAWASDQSKPLNSRKELEDYVVALEKHYAEGEIPRPPHWSGFRLTPLEIEFWHDRPFRLHDRIVFIRSEPKSAWEKTRLYP
ncbi:MAG: pyridoxamine 5'-phosphate oxidase [Hyphomicrobiaceae bacterium]